MKWLLAMSATLLILTGCGESAPGAADQHHEEEEHHDEEMLVVDEHKLEQMDLQTVTVEQQVLGRTIDVLGNLQPDQDRYAAVGSPIEARVVELFASPGDSVRRGEPLARLQSPELGRARAAVESARARLNLTEQTLERKEGLGAGRIVPQREIEEAQSQVAAARAELRAAMTGLEALSTGATAAGGDSLFLLRAPISGTILDRSIARGQMISPSDDAFRIGDLSEVWFIGRVFEREVVKLREGAAATVVLAAAPEQSFPGTVTWIGREVDPGSKTVPVRIELENRNGFLRPGMSATASIAVGAEAEAVVTVPKEALQRLEDHWVVFIPDGEGRFEIREVVRESERDDVAVVSGVEPWETVVAQGSFLLKAEVEMGEGGGDHHGH